MNELVQRVNSLLVRKEGEHLEVKEARNRYDFEELVRYCCALANEGGGHIILGATDQLPRRVVGTQAFSDFERTKAGINERLHIRVNGFEVAHPDGRVLLLEIPSRPVGLPIAYWSAPRKLNQSE